MIITITNNNAENARPSSIGSNSISIGNRATYTFTIADFTSGTNPPYTDPEGDPMSYIKIIARPGIGELQLNGVPVVNDDLIFSGDISSGNFTYVSQDNDSYYTEKFLFDVADEGSSTLSGLTDGVFNVEVAELENQPPDSVGDITLSTDYGTTITFTVANFTTETSPAYNDPEGDSPYKLKILSLPSTGTLSHNQVNVVLNQEILFSEIFQGYFVYIPDPANTNSYVDTFDYEISDEGSEQYFGG